LSGDDDCEGGFEGGFFCFVFAGYHSEDGSGGCAYCGGEQ